MPRRSSTGRETSQLWSREPDARVVIYEITPRVAGRNARPRSARTRTRRLERRRAPIAVAQAAADAFDVSVGHGAARRRGVRRGRGADARRSRRPRCRRPPLRLARRCAGQRPHGAAPRARGRPPRARARARPRVLDGVALRAADRAASRRRPSGSRPATSTSRSSTASRTSWASSRAPSTACGFALSQLERARREFVGNASHELRTPLFSLARLHRAARPTRSSTRRRGASSSRRWASRSTRLQRLAEDLLDLTRARRRPDAHRAPAPVDLAEVGAGSGGGVPRRRGRDGASARGRRAGGARARRRRSGSCGSAARSSRTRSSTRRRAPRVRVARGRTTLAVEDDGPGHPAEHAGHVFDRFYRVDGARRPGAGSASRSRASSQTRWTARLELESRHGWTSFMLRLPAAPDESRRRFHVKTSPRGSIDANGYVDAGYVLGKRGRSNATETAPARVE